VSIVLTIIACVSSLHSFFVQKTIYPLSNSFGTGLNTCVGKANYSYFFRTMISISLMLVVHASIQLALVLDIYLGNGASRSEEWFNADATTPVVVVICAFLLFDLVALSLIGQLLLFHNRLQREGLTTYQFIVRDNQRKREQNKQDQELAQKRLVAMAKAEEEGRTCDWLSLRIGGDVRKTCGLTCCDPLEEKPKLNNPHAALNGNGHSQTATNGTAESRPHAQEESKEAEDP
jgi:hypothetical protein